LDLMMAKKLFRSDLSANVWWPSKLSEKQLLEFYGQK
jgi:ribose transport system substrate-binding protein